MTRVKRTVENGVVVFTVSIRKWSANKKLRAEHTRAKAEDLPPEDLISLGVRKVFDPKALAPFEAIRKETERLCFNEGTSYFGGIAVPNSEADSFAEKLDDLKQRFNKAKADLEESYEAKLATWVGAHPGWEHTMEGALSVQEAMSRFHFDYTPVEVILANADTQSETATVLEKKLQSNQAGFVGQLYDEIAQMANSYRKDSLLGKEKATTRGLAAVHAMRKKLNGLAFLDKRIRPLVEMIDQVLAEMPASGAIEGTGLATLLGVTSIMSDTDTMQQFGEQVISGASHKDLLSMWTAPPVKSEPKKPEQPAVETQPGIPLQARKIVPVAPTPQAPSNPTNNAGWGFIPARIAA